MINWSWRRSERLARALDDPEGSANEQTVAELRAAEALTPRLAPRESWRQQLKEQVLREAQRVREPARPDAGSQDDSVGAGIHTLRIDWSDSAEVVLADVEAIDDRRAAEVADRLARIARAFAPGGQQRSPE